MKSRKQFDDPQLALSLNIHQSCSQSILNVANITLTVLNLTVVKWLMHFFLTKIFHNLAMGV